MKGRKNAVTIILGFVLLFSLYHLAEYMIVFKNSPAGFLLFQGLFFVAAWGIGKWQFGNGLAAWGLTLPGRLFRQIFFGILAGISIYTITYFLALQLHIEQIASTPSGKQIVSMLGLYIFGNFFSSFRKIFLPGDMFIPIPGKSCMGY